jgi:hypothetical protein
MMLTLLRPLVVPPRLATGRRSTRPMKPVTVQLSTKGGEPSESVRSDSKVSLFTFQCEPPLT